MEAPAADAGRVRFAARHDEPNLMELCRRYHAECGLGSLNEDKLRAVMARSFNPGRNSISIIGVVGTAGRVEGSICLAVEPLWYNDDQFLVELWNFVLPEFRASTNAKDLIAFAKQMTEPAPIGVGVPLLTTLVCNRQTEAKERLYRRALGEPNIIAWLVQPSAVTVH